MLFTELKYQPERCRCYLGSPSIIRTKSGLLVASHDYFESDWRKNMETRISEIYFSEDDGVSWQNSAHLSGAFWGSLFEADGALYHISISREYGNLVIRRSEDDGFTWTSPFDGQSGLIRQAGEARKRPNYHFGGATPVLIRNGRIYKACEQFDNESDNIWRACDFQAGLLSAPLGSDLLNAKNWEESNWLKLDSGSCPEVANQHSGWLEGNPVEAPDSSLKLILRAHLKESNKAVLLHWSDESGQLSFDGMNSIVDFPGGASKFTIRRDPVTKQYFVLSNPVRDLKTPSQRNILTLSASPDLVHWTQLKDIMEDDSGLTADHSTALTGFQYTDWQFDGEDIIALVRMGYRGAHNFHDSNRIGFKRIKNFRNLLR